jgi:hypothetical protein
MSRSCPRAAASAIARTTVSLGRRDRRADPGASRQLSEAAPRACGIGAQERQATRGRPI